ncbi:MAG: SBBP repeat-containing protein, partial [Candidatus Aminicenantes bacterium]|nr:SBBP repeat-containing protein [Candidatus Aminicenantes bacterium]
MIDYKKNVFLSLLVFFFILSGCVIDSDSVDRIDYGNGFYFQWYTFIGDAGSNQKVSEITHDSEGNLYIIGTSDVPLDSKYGDPLIPHSADNQNLLLKMNPDGIILWHTFLPGSWYKIATDHEDQIVLYGRSDKEFNLTGIKPVSSFNGGKDVSLIKFDSQGSVLWHSFLGGLQTDSNGRMEIDNEGIIYILGTSNSGWNSKFGVPVVDIDNSSTSKAYFLGKIEPHGNLISHTFINIRQSGTSENSLSVGKNGDIYVSLIHYSGHYRGWITKKLEKNLIEIPDVKSIFGKIYSLQSGGYLSYFGSGRLYYGYDEEKVMFRKYNEMTDQIWEFEIINEGDGPMGHASLGIHDLKIDIHDDIYFVGKNAGKLLKDYYD